MKTWSVEKCIKLATIYEKKGRRYEGGRKLKDKRTESLIRTANVIVRRIVGVLEFVL